MPPQKVRVRIRTAPGRLTSARYRLRRLVRRIRPHLVVAAAAVAGAVVIWVVLGHLGRPPAPPE